MARTKDYKAKASGVGTDLAADLEATDAVVALPPNPRNQNLIDRKRSINPVYRLRSD